MKLAYNAEDNTHYVSPNLLKDNNLSSYTNAQSGLAYFNIKLTLN